MDKSPRRDTPIRYDDLGIPTRWDLRRNMGVCAAVNCGRSRRGVVLDADGLYDHECACCLEHCHRSGLTREEKLSLRLARGNPLWGLEGD